MATLTKVKSEKEDAPSLGSSIPTPFPKEILAVNSSSSDEQQSQRQRQESEPGPSNISKPAERQENGSLVRINTSILIYLLTN